jgi:hypothetical protein
MPLFDGKNWTFGPCPCKDQGKEETITNPN